MGTHHFHKLAPVLKRQHPAEIIKYFETTYT